MKEQLYNQRFGDIYFSPEDGLAETRHVFLAGNDLPVRWEGRAHFTIAETGFGSGLNFLAAWTLFEDTAAPDATLDYVSYELYPLAVSDIRDALERWSDEFGGRLERMLATYPLRVSGFHRIRFSERVTLTLVFDDVNDALPQTVIARGVDAWFLDGFAPAKNPQMWTPTLFTEMARLSAPDASVATFTAAGAVRRGLVDVGFAVSKVPGYGRKREMVVARRETQQASPCRVSAPIRIAIIGGGLAGAACAYVLQQAGREVTIYEAADTIAAGASGNARGLLNPRFTALRGAESDFYAPAFAQAVRTLDDISKWRDIGYKRCGALHFVNSAEKEKRFRSLCENWGWHQDHVRYVDAAEASRIAGINVPSDALYLPDSGFVNPALLCEALAQDVRVITGKRVLPGRDGGHWRVDGEEYDIVILANASGAVSFDVLSWLPVHTVRGQITAVRASAESMKLGCNLCYGGYLSAPMEGWHMLGSSFQRWLNNTDMREEDDRDNLQKLENAVPGIVDGLSITGSRAGLRTVAQDHFPVIGPARDEDGVLVPGLYVSTAHGSHGIVSALAGAHLIADMALACPYSLPQRSVEALDCKRFSDRGKRRGRTMG